MNLLENIGMWIFLIVMLSKLHVFFMSVLISKISPKNKRASNVLEYNKSRPLNSIKSKLLGLKVDEK